MRILVGLDFSEESIYGLDSAYSLCAGKGGEIIVAHVVEDSSTTTFNVMGVADGGKKEGELFMSLLIKKVRERLETLVADEKYEGVKMSYHLKVGKVFDKMREIIANDTPDFLVMGSKGSGGLQEVFLGSNAEKMSRFCPCPLIVVKSQRDLSKVKNIVYPTDFRKDQLPVVEKVKYVQGLLGAHVHLVRVFDPALLPDVDVLQKVAEFANTHEMTNCTPNVWHHHDESEGILEFSGSIEADLVVMGTHGRKGIASLLGGGISKHVINHAYTPVCVVNMRH